MQAIKDPGNCGSAAFARVCARFVGFTSSYICFHSGDSAGGTERFAMKFVENFVDQQGPEQLLPFLSDAMETPPDNPLTSCNLHDDTMVTSSPPTGQFE